MLLFLQTFTNLYQPHHQQYFDWRKSTLWQLTTAVSGDQKKCIKKLICKNPNVLFLQAPPQMPGLKHLLQVCHPSSSLYFFLYLPNLLKVNTNRHLTPIMNNSERALRPPPPTPRKATFNLKLLAAISEIVIQNYLNNVK